MYSASNLWIGTILACLLLLATLAWASGVAFAREETSGADEFRISCASCHGEDGKGGGYLASILTVQPADLTALGRNNQGEFPESRVYGIIDGREAFHGHGDRAMPVWERSISITTHPRGYACTNRYWRTCPALPLCRARGSNWA